ncbi:MAG: radical SAM family heme chaperone HemW [Chitinophagaceae bacterium]|nr:radical SAM family heme chaperone HemW [Chitinophagaceae bacterium]
MAGIYLHIPFCKQACNYCNFHFSTSLRYKLQMIDAIIKEIELQKDYLKGEIVHTIYFGGGTPSLLSTEDYQLLIGTIQKYHQIDNDPEATLEANPDDITEAKLQAWKDIGINRLSIGIQSFFEQELQWMNRAHSAQLAIRSLLLSMKYFHNISVDLIYGSPLLTDEIWAHNVQTALSYNIPHLSCYALTIEEKTPLHKQIMSNQNPNIDADKQARQFTLLMKWLHDAGYEHYEISNFAKQNFRSRHNSNYWKGEKYLGLGPSAHSYNGFRRQWNVANNNNYIISINNGVIPFEHEELTNEKRLNEYIMISLRTSEGMDLQVVEKNWGGETRKLIEKKSSLFNGLIHYQNSVMKLTDKGMLLADRIASELFS